MRKIFLLLMLLAVVFVPANASAGTLNGTVTQWVDGKEKPLSGALVLIGKDIWLDTSKSVDVVKGKVIAKATTNSSGNYSLTAPNGKYTMIIWKSHYVPQDGLDATVPGSCDGSISYDNQVGSSGRHTGIRYE